MTKSTAFGTLTDGQLTLSSRKRFTADLREMRDGEVEIIVKRRGRRSSPQNRYYFGCVLTEIRQKLVDCGNRLSVDDVHSLMKMKFNLEPVCNDHGEVIDHLPGHTSGLNKEEFGEYLDKVMEWASTVLGVYIPPPNTQTSFFNEQIK